MSNNAKPREGDRLVRNHELDTMTGVSSETRRRWELAGTWPKRVRLGPRSVGWWLSEVQAVLDARREAA